jgi:hypothetical protein
MVAIISKGQCTLLILHLSLQTQTKNVTSWVNSLSPLSLSIPPSLLFSSLLSLSSLCLFSISPTLSFYLSFSLYLSYLSLSPSLLFSSFSLSSLSLFSLSLLSLSSLSLFSLSLILSPFSLSFRLYLSLPFFFLFLFGVCSSLLRNN